MQDKFLTFQFFAVGEMLKIMSKLVQGLLNFRHFFTLVRDLAAQFHRISAEEQSAPEQFKVLLPHGEEFPRFDSWCGGKRHGDAPF